MKDEESRLSRRPDFNSGGLWVFLGKKRKRTSGVLEEIMKNLTPAGLKP